jgi:hypothetical protein
VTDGELLCLAESEGPWVTSTEPGHVTDSEIAEPEPASEPSSPAMSKAMAILAALAAPTIAAPRSGES